MEIKYNMHVPVEQWGYIGCEIEGTAAEAVEAYREIANQLKFGDGLPEKGWRKLYDDISSGIEVNGDPGMPELNAFQRFAVGEARKFLSRKAGIKNTMNNYKNHD